MYYLHLKPLTGQERRVTLAPGATKVGRDAGNTLVLDEYGVSGSHAEIVTHGRDVKIRDLGSTNGVFVNGRQVEEADVLPGDRILLGSVLVVLQEAVSDRIRIHENGTVALGDEPEADPVRITQSVMEKAYVPIDASSGPPATDAGEASEEATPGDILRLFQEVTSVEIEEGAQEALERSLRSIARFTGARGGFLLGLRGPEDYYLRACAGIEDELVISRAVIQRATETGAPVCLDDQDGTSFICLPLGGPGRSVGAVYLAVGADAMPGAKERAYRLQPVLSALALILRNADQREALARAEQVLATDATMPEWVAIERSRGYDFVSHSRSIRDLLAKVDNVAVSDGAVLIRGEIGTGRERVARRIHMLGGRRRAPFVRVNCSESRGAELDAELFGVETSGDGEEQVRKGELELAHGGTVFLDEIGELSPPLQIGMLRVIRRGEFLRVGGKQPVHSNVRLMAATRWDLRDRLLEGRFIDDLHRELRRTEIDVPPLRERRTDIIPLAQRFVRRYANSMHKSIRGLSMDACRALQDYPWPGNVLELRSVISRAVMLATDEIIDVDQLPLDISAGSLNLNALRGLSDVTEMPWKDAKSAFERAYFREMIERNEGNISRSSRQAGIARKNFYYKLRQLGIKQP